MQKVYDYGPRDFAEVLPILRLPVEDNPDPKRLDYPGARRIFEDLCAGLSNAETTLRKAEDPGVKVPLHFGKIRLELRSGGTNIIQPLWELYRRYQFRAEWGAKEADAFLIAFDRSDVYWLRAYCHLLMGMCDFLLSYDWSGLFHRTGHRIFKNVATPYPFFEDAGDSFEFEFGDIMDAVAFIHLIDFPLLDGKRLQSALSHFEGMVGLSKQTWVEILSEKDDDHEWIPNTNQTGVIPGMEVTADMIAGWTGFLDETALILQGKRLVPFWRIDYSEFKGSDGSFLPGINLRKAFTDPRPFDLVLWVQGTDAYPYMEKGRVTDMRVWMRLMNVFRGNFINYAVWFN